MFRNIREKLLNWVLRFFLDVLFRDDFDRTLGYARSSKWEKTRTNFLKNKPFCAVCGSIKNLNVHHIVPFHKDRTKELDMDNLITLCENQCHFIFGHLGSWRSWNETVVDDAKMWNNKIINRN